MAKRTTHRSSKGTKLYAVRDKKGRFKDIQTYKRAHGMDIKRKSKGETAREKVAALAAIAAKLALRREIESLSPDRQSGRLTRCVTEQARLPRRAMPAPAARRRLRSIGSCSGGASAGFVEPD